LETTLQRGADIPTLLLIKILIPSYAALITAIKIKSDVSTVKRICIIWNIYRCDMAYCVSVFSKFLWGMENLSVKRTAYPLFVNEVHAANKQFDKIDFSVDGTIHSIGVNKWLYEHMGNKVFRDCSWFDIGEDIISDHAWKTLNNDTYRRAEFQFILERMIYHNKFKEVGQLYEKFKDFYSVNLDSLESHLIGSIVRVRRSEDLIRKYLDLLVFLGAPHWRIYKAVFFLEVDNILSYIRDIPDETFGVILNIRDYRLLDCSELTDQLTREEYDRLDLILDMGYPIDENSNQDEIIFYYQRVEEKRIKLIRNRVMTDLDVICKTFREFADSIGYVKAYTEVHGEHTLKSVYFQIYPCSEEHFSWLAHTLMTNEYVGKRTECLPYHPVAVSHGTVEYWDFLKLEENSVSWKEGSFYYFPKNLQVHLAFWNYFEGDRMYFD
jgi:hypothetical protein